MAAFCFSRMIGLFIGMVAMGVMDNGLDACTAYWDAYNGCDG